MKNVLKREYNGFFALFLSFAWVDGLHAVREFGVSEVRLQPLWWVLLAFAFAVFLILRTLKKTTKVLDVAGREYV